MIFSRIQSQDFAVQSLNDELYARAPNAGAIVTFVGRVRDYNLKGNIQGIELEHYPGMTEKALAQVAQQTQQKFSLAAVGVVHRVGAIGNQQQIVWVGTASAHRQAAFDGASYLMDMLKQSVPLWKKEWQQGQSCWVEAKQSDELAALKWMSNEQNK
jgi:molybdopterin synthase catalytic subunit